MVRRGNRWGRQAGRSTAGRLADPEGAKTELRMAKRANRGDNFNLNTRTALSAIDKD